jgi:predicted metalloprotease with PDZ domain
MPCFRLMLSLLLPALCLGARALGSPGPAAPVSLPRMPVALDRPFPGRVELRVDASDADRRLLRVHEHLSGLKPGAVLFYPQWLPGNHSPSGPIDRIMGIRMSSHGQPVPWSRDTGNVYAFRPSLPAGTSDLEVDFEYASPVTSKVGPIDFSRENLIFDWNQAVLYPAGFFARQIPVDATLTLPAGWTLGTALEPVSRDGDTTRFRTVSLEQLIDSPVYAGRYSRVLDLDPNGKIPVHLNLFADRPEHLDVSAAALNAHRQLVQQAYRLYRSHHYAHYDFLYSLSDDVQQKGLEHPQSTEVGAAPTLFTEWDANAPARDLLAHEYTHSWNGKFRRPADLWTPNYNVPMQNSLLWVYEGQTEYWGQVLAARSGLRTLQQSLDQWALTAATYDQQPGRAWRPLQDTTNDAIMNYHRPNSWRNYERYMDYYDEGALIWLDADTLIRERSGGARSLDDFAAAFFSVNDGSTTTLTYRFEDVIQALERIEPYDWAGFFRERLDATGRPAPLAGLTRGGYRLVYTETASDYEKASAALEKRTSFEFSIGVVLDKDGVVEDCRWGSAAFDAGIAQGVQLLAVDGRPYSGEVLADAITAAKSNKSPIELILKLRDQYRVVKLNYTGGLRHPHLVRESESPSLERILAPRAE